MVHSVALIENKCRGCTTCIKNCPTEAIRVRGRKAYLSPDRCIDCGTCVAKCPHTALKTVTDSFDVLKKYKYNVAIPDPVLYGQFRHLQDINIVLTALLKIGFDDVYEAASAAEILAKHTSVSLEQDNKEKGPLISSCCPSVLRMIRIRFPELINHVVNTITPMQLASILARRRAVEKTGLKPEEIGIIGIVPCPAQVTAVENPELLKEPVMDAAIAIKDVYTKLLDPMKNLEVIKPLRKCGSAGLAHGYVGGEAKARGAIHYLAVDGIENCINMLNAIENDDIPPADYIELNACVQGCAGGCLNVENPYSARLRLKRLGSELPNYYQEYEEKVVEETKDLIYGDKILDYSPAFLLDSDRKVALAKLAKIQEIRKHLPGLDCASCGAPSCNAFAEDIVQGRASEDDCIFKLREKIKNTLGENAADAYLPAYMRSAHYNEQKNLNSEKSETKDDK